MATDGGAYGHLIPGQSTPDGFSSPVGMRMSTNGVPVLPLKVRPHQPWKGSRHRKQGSRESRDRACRPSRARRGHFPVFRVDWSKFLSASIPLRMPLNELLGGHLRHKVESRGDFRSFHEQNSLSNQ